MPACVRLVVELREERAKPRTPFSGCSRACRERNKRHRRLLREWIADRRQLTETIAELRAQLAHARRSMP